MAVNFPGMDKFAEITRYRLQNGEKTICMVKVGKEYATKAGHMYISMEELNTGMIAFYIRFRDEEEENEYIELYDPKGKIIKPTDIVKKMIQMKWTERHEE